MAKGKLPSNIVIVGGSLSDLFAALAIPGLVHSVNVLERYKEDQLNDRGAGLRIGPEVYEFLVQYVQKPELDASMVVFDGLKILDRGGMITHAVDVEVRVTNWGNLLRSCFNKPSSLPCLKVKEGLAGNVEKQRCTRETARMSSLLYDAGRELNAVRQSKEIDTGDTFSFFAERQKHLFRDIAAISEESEVDHGKQGRRENDTRMTDVIIHPVNTISEVYN